MSQSSGIVRAIGYAFSAAVAASLSVLLVGVCVFGRQFAEWEGRLVGVLGTIAGVIGAVIGLRTALRKERPAPHDATRHHAS